MTQEEIKSLRELAKQVYDSVGPDKAEKELVRRITRTPEYASAAVAFAAHYLVRLCGHNVRTIITQAQDHEEQRPKQHARKTSQEVMERVAAYAGKYLSWPMSVSRKTLGDSMREEVAAEAEMYERQAQGNSERGRFMRLVQKRTPGGKTVGEVLSDDALAKLYSKAKAGE
jgi:hypothetical protein